LHKVQNSGSGHVLAVCLSLPQLKQPTRPLTASGSPPARRRSMFRYPALPSPVL